MSGFWGWLGKKFPLTYFARIDANALRRKEKKNHIRALHRLVTFTALNHLDFPKE